MFRGQFQKDERTNSETSIRTDSLPGIGSESLKITFGYRAKLTKKLNHRLIRNSFFSTIQVPG